MVPGMQRFSPGDRVALREIWHGRVWAAFPVVVVEDRDDVFMNHIPAGVTIQEPVAEDGIPLRLPSARWSLRPTRVQGDRVLAFSFPGRSYAVLLLWEGSTDTFGGYYLNIETLLGRTPISVDVVDHLLDVRVAPDRSTWAWKDEDELAEAVARGIYTEEDARSFRAAGERALRHVLEAEPPFDRDWSAWRPDPAWPRPELPAGWDRV
jgi:predicted RNA-binding protein associated with RNAse of E/G family